MSIKYNSDIGAFVNTGNYEKVTQAELLVLGCCKSRTSQVKPKLTKAKSPDRMVEEGVESITIKENIMAIDKPVPNVTETVVKVPKQEE